MYEAQVTGCADVAQEPEWAVGRVVCDSEGHLNASSVLLEGTLQHSQGHSVKLDLSQLPSYRLFPGQACCETSLYCQLSWHCQGWSGHLRAWQSTALRFSRTALSRRMLPCLGGALLGPFHVFSGIESLAAGCCDGRNLTCA